MINNLYELNDVLNAVANRALDIVAENSTSGQRYVDHSDVADLISREDFLKYADFIAYELSGRPEVLEPVTLDDGQLDINMGLAYCKAYQWCDGDEEIFGCSYEEWLKMEAEPVSHPLSMSRMAEIGASSVAYILESKPEKAMDELTECIGLSVSEVETLQTDSRLGKSQSFQFRLMDPGSRQITLYDNFEDALNTYQGLGNSEGKHLSVLLPESSPWAGAIGILQQENGKDVLLNTDVFTEQIQRQRIHFADTSVEKAFALAEQYVDLQKPVRFYVGCSNFEKSEKFYDFEAALERYKSIEPGFERDISFLVYDDQHRGHGANLLMNTGNGADRPCGIGKEALENPHIALAHAKSIISCYPFDEKAWEMRDAAEKALGITDRIVDISNDFLINNWRVHVIPTGGRYGMHNVLVNEGTPLVEFYDMSHRDDKHAANGLFTGARYTLQTLLEKDRRGGEAYPAGLSLDYECPEWTVSPQDMKQVVDYLKNFGQQKSVKPSLNDRIGEAQAKASSSPDVSHHKAGPER